jgi:predicted membrane protein
MNYGTPPGAGKPQGLAITSLVLGIAAHVFCFIFFWIAPVLAIGAIITGIMARNGAKAGTQGGAGMALAGLILGIVNLVLCLILIVLIFVAGVAFLGFMKTAADEAQRQNQMNQPETAPVEMFRMTLEYVSVHVRALLS